MLDDDDDDEDTARRIYCPIVGCGFRLTSLENFEDHYNTRHSACCSVCNRVYPSSRLLSIHVSEAHDSFFQAKVARGYPMNIQRLEIDNEPDNTNHLSLSEILEEESNKGSARKGASCSKAILWLIRSLDFTVALLERLVIDKEQKMDEALEDSYNVTLKQWHGWISYAAFKVALKLVPDNKTFISILMGKDANYEKLQEDMQSFILLLVPILKGCHSMLHSSSNTVQHNAATQHNTATQHITLVAHHSNNINTSQQQHQQYNTAPPAASAVQHSTSSSTNSTAAHQQHHQQSTSPSQQHQQHNRG